MDSNNNRDRQQQLLVIVAHCPSEHMAIANEERVVAKRIMNLQSSGEQDHETLTTKAYRLKFGPT